MQRGIQIVVVMVLIAVSVPFGAASQSGSTISAYGCTIDPMQPKNPNGDMIAKAQYRCSTNRPNRALRTQLEQRRADGNWYPVPDSIKVRAIPNDTNGNWIAANTPQVQCQNISGTKKFRTVVMITDGEGNVTDTMSNVAEWDQQCVDVTDFPGPYVAVVYGSNDINNCWTVLEEVSIEPNSPESSDPADDFANPDYRSDPEPCEGGMVISRITPQTEAEWTLAVAGIYEGIPSLRRLDGSQDVSQAAKIVPMSGNESQDEQTISSQEIQVRNFFASQDTEDDPLAAQLASAQAGPCELGNLTLRRHKSLYMTSNDRGGTMAHFEIFYRRVTCETWRIYGVTLTHDRGPFEVRASSHTYDLARDFGSNFPFKPLVSDWKCRIIPLLQPIKMDPDDKWEIIPGYKPSRHNGDPIVWFNGATYIQSDIFIDPRCRYNGGTHMTGATYLSGPRR